MDIYGLLGYPLGHSYSARYFHDKFEREHIDADYVNFEYATVDDALARFAEMPSLRGFNVTIPHKQAIIPHLTAVSVEAKAIGAVNVVKVSHHADGTQEMTGHNTDWIGFSKSIAPMLCRCKGRRALVLGNGGASKAVLFAMQRMGWTTQVVARHPHSADEMTFVDLSANMVKEYDAIINCTPLGMYPHVETSPSLPYEALSSSHVLYDLVYNPETTAFMRQGTEHGAQVKNGLEMLHIQADEAWRIWNE